MYLGLRWFFFFKHNSLEIGASSILKNFFIDFQNIPFIHYTVIFLAYTKYIRLQFMYFKWSELLPDHKSNYNHKVVSHFPTNPNIFPDKIHKKFPMLIIHTFSS